MKRIYVFMESTCLILNHFQYPDKFNFVYTLKLFFLNLLPKNSGHSAKEIKKKCTRNLSRYVVAYTVHLTLQ